MKKILTIILDGFGLREEVHGNAPKAAEMHCFEKIWNEYPHSILDASEEKVGLHHGQFGNSETGHSTIGAGHIIKQNETIVDEFLASDVSTNEKFQDLLNYVDRDIHLMGLCSDGMTHSSINQIISMYKILVKYGFKKIHFHVITDGRDTGVHEAMKYINMITDVIKEYEVGDIATICGRYYAMDRNKKFERTKQYYDLITKGIGINGSNIEEVINKLYEHDITDEYLRPIIVNKESIIKNGDVLIWLNFRSDRAKQILDSLTNKEYSNFPTVNLSELIVYSFFSVDDDICTNNLLSEQVITNPLGIYLAKLGLSQARVAETEKFPHITYFFDGGYDGKIDNCDKFLIPSPSVATYDLQPEMSAIEVTKKVIECMVKDYDFILVNYANPDMVGHTGNFDAAVKACMTVDVCLSKLIEKANDNFYKVIILSDHGNVDIMLDDFDVPVTTHTLSKVPFIILDKNIKLKEYGDLTNVAPTILEYMDIAVPEEMKNTENLIK